MAIRWGGVGMQSKAGLWPQRRRETSSRALSPDGSSEQRGPAPGMFAVLNRATRTALLVQYRMVLLQQRPQIYSKPPKHKIGPGQSFFIMSVFAVTLLVPAGWIMHHLPEYRQRPRPPPK
ncbi:hypothetical protein AAFF_G00240890 [Aldrovandia affinis]|uniref:Uncharacterized protein n=1 Tax=Aldrovandia affinis TaxID=143900 RepID=A0AAD7SVN7_9TELE|nr:hypothetical protein AAFF_G00240890 [Aldrovandia affinis]